MAGIAQSFYLNSSALPAGLDGIYINSVDLYFFETDPNLGCTVALMMVENGYPTANLLPHSTVHLLPSQINTSNNSSVVTNISFTEPVYLETGDTYAIGIYPDGANPNYALWTGEIGGNDVISGSPIYSLACTGEMFTMGQSFAWVAYNNECLKFNLYPLNFTANSATPLLVNGDFEFMSVANAQGNFILNESVFYSNNVVANLLANISSTSNTVNIPNTSTLSANVKIYINSPTNKYSLIANVNSVVDGTHITINATPAFTDANATLGILTGNSIPLTGTVSFTNSIFMMVGNSSANTTTYLNSNAGVMIGSQSQVQASITNLLDIPYDSLMPKIFNYAPPFTSVSFNMIGTANSFNSYAQDANTTGLKITNEISFLDKERVIMSLSNEKNFLAANTKSLQIYGNMTTTTPWTSPAVEMIKAGALTIYNIINGEDSNNDIYYSETTNSGNGINRYISQTVTLAPGLEAEDLTVYIGAYMPAGTNVYCYAKILCQYDSDSFVNKAWTPMFTTNTVRSSMVNTQDFNEYKFSFANTIPVSNAYNMPYSAYSDTTNNNVVAYTTPSGQKFETFNSFAVKLVLVSNNGSYSVPRVTDLRCLASQSTA